MIKDNDVVFVVLKNSDFTEGRGRMMFHKVFKTEKLAHDYVMSEPGIYGSKQRLESRRDNVQYYNGYMVILTPVLESILTKEEEQIIMGEISDLEDRINKLKLMLK